MLEYILRNNQKAYYLLSVPPIPNEICGTYFLNLPFALQESVVRQKMGEI